MAEARERDRSVARTRARSPECLIVPGRETKSASADNSGITAVPLSKKRFEHVAGKRRQLGKVLAGYADSVAEAAKTGRPIDVTFRVSPDGDAQPILAASEGDVLDVALAKARDRGQAKVAEILKGEDMLTAREFASLIGASHETVNAKRKRFEILGLEGATRGLRYPRWQVTDAGLPLPGLPQVFAALGAQPWTVYRFLRAAQAELGGRTALDTLKAGQIESVVGIAHNQVTGRFA